MTVTDVPVHLSSSLEGLEATLDEALLHLECCRVERFYCGAPFHPEASAGPDADEDEICERCLDILQASWCFRGHQHCPMSSPFLSGIVCPQG